MSASPKSDRWDQTYGAIGHPTVALGSDPKRYDVDRLIDSAEASVYKDIHLQLLDLAQQSKPNTAYCEQLGPAKR